LRAAQHGRCTEAKIRDILENAVRPITRIQIGAALDAFGQQAGGLTSTSAPPPEPTEPADFE
jgi:plasmid stability protein